MKKLGLLLALLVVAGMGTGAYYRFFGRTAPPSVTTATLSRGDVVDAVGATGTLEAVTTVLVGTQVSGTIDALHADFNSVVRSGQVIARLDPSLFNTQIEQARANLVRSQADAERLRVSLEDARSRLARAEELAARQLISRQDLEAAQIVVRSTEAQIRSAEAAVTQARATLNQNLVNQQHTVIRAPIDGIVISRNVDVGQTVAASMQAPTLFVIAADLTKMRVNANIDEADVGRIRPGQRVRFRVDAFPTGEFLGTVSQVRLQPQTVQNVVTYATVIDVPNPDFRLKPGMTANVSIEIARRTDVLRIPNVALRFRPADDVFAALGQPVPPELERGFGRGSAGGAAPAHAGADGRETPPETAGTRPAPGSGGEPGRPNEGDATERRKRLLERLEAMPPAEREEAMRRLRERGVDPTTGSAVQTREGAAVSEGPPGNRRTTPLAGGAPASTARPTPAPAGAPGTPARAAWQQADSIDALFPPLPATEALGRAWVFVDGRLEPVRLRLGVSDGTYTEVLGGDLTAGQDVVTSVAVPARTARAAGSQSPLMGSPARGGPPGVRNTAPQRGR
jgi:HlyD family secretion protein